MAGFDAATTAAAVAAFSACSAITRLVRATLAASSASLTCCEFISCPASLAASSASRLASAAAFSAASASRLSCAAFSAREAASLSAASFSFRCFSSSSRFLAFRSAIILPVCCRATPPRLWACSLIAARLRRSSRRRARRRIAMTVLTAQMIPVTLIRALSRSSLRMRAFSSSTSVFSSGVSFSFACNRLTMRCLICEGGVARSSSSTLPASLLKKTRLFPRM
mmetsp:Transcript_23757/g.54034  ORF Transcript_23757/g.54034 Transcript_23757/m.54034 type:complete len:224 (-) Transcript_23757:2240-2911(-)